MSNVSFFWFRRDLRLHDNAGLYRALSSGYPVVPLFIFDTRILGELDARDDARVTFIHQSLEELDRQLRAAGSSLLVKTGDPQVVWRDLLAQFQVAGVYCNEDYEPYARERDGRIAALVNAAGASFHAGKDQVVFSKSEVMKDDGSPYTVFTPYKRKWLEKLDPKVHLHASPSGTVLAHLYPYSFEPVPDLKKLGFVKSTQVFPGKTYQGILSGYGSARDFPAVPGTSRIGIHLRFGTLSIRDLAMDGLVAPAWLNELIWRDFYAMILWHFPHTIDHAFKPAYDRIAWRNSEREFEAWCTGMTGYPIVDAGMRELNATGWMHNRVRMITASFLVKHLLIDWRWGERYFAGKLLDYDLASNVGGWQWAAGSGNDAAPYFRVFNPALQAQKFDPQSQYIRKWVTEFDDPWRYPKPIVDHREARERALRVYSTSVTFTLK